MHELGMAQDLFQIVKKEAEKNNIKKVSKIVLKLGEASGVKEDFLRHSFVDHILPGSIAEGAELVIITEALKAKCRDCGKVMENKGETVMKCPDCDSSRLEIIEGMKVYVENIEGE